MPPEYARLGDPPGPIPRHGRVSHRHSRREYRCQPAAAYASGLGAAPAAVQGERFHQGGASVRRNVSEHRRLQQPLAAGQQGDPVPVPRRSGQVSRSLEEGGRPRIAGQGADQDLPQPEDFYHVHPHPQNRPHLEGYGGGGRSKALLCPLPPLRRVHRTEVVPGEVPGRRHGQHRTLGARRLHLPGVRRHHHRSAQASNAPAGGMAGGRGTGQTGPKGGLLDQYPVFPLRSPLGNGKGLPFQQGRSRPFPELHKLLVCGALGGYEAQNQRRSGAGAPDGPPGVHSPGVGEGPDRWSGRAGNQRLLDHPSLGQPPHLAEHSPRTGPQLLRDRADHEPSVCPGGRRGAAGGRPGPHRQRRQHRCRL